MSQPRVTITFGRNGQLNEMSNGELSSSGKPGGKDRKDSLNEEASCGSFGSNSDSGVLRSVQVNFCRRSDAIESWMSVHPVGQRRATVSRDMYSDQINGGGAGGNRKRSVRERLGGAQEQASAVVRLPKRTRLDDGKWKHDMYEEKEDIPIRQPTAQDLDLRARLGRRNISRGQGEVSSTGGVKDLREKLSGPIQAPQVNRDVTLQRRLQSVVRGSSGIASLASGRPGISRNSAITQKAPMLQKTVVHKAQAMEVDENSIAGFLQSLGLSKYLITFQAEEVDMAALRHMGDDDLKELGVPMGPRKKILLAIGSRG